MRRFGKELIDTYTDDTNHNPSELGRTMELCIQENDSVLLVPAHTITFLLPEEARVLFAALLGVVLGILLAVAARKK